MYMAWGQYQLQWPQAREREMHLRNVIPAFPLADGHVDGTEVSWQKADSSTYSGKAGRHTLLHQVTSTWYGRIIHVVSGEKGSTNDRALFTKSALFINQHLYFSEGEYLIADGGYAGDGPIRTPITSPDTEQMQLNAYISFHRAANETVNQRIKKWFPFAGDHPRCEHDIAVLAFLCACAFVNYACDSGEKRWLRGQEYLCSCIAEYSGRNLQKLKWLHLSRPHADVND